jgi:spermidine synthase
MGPDRTMRSLRLDSTVEGAQIAETGELTVQYQQYWHLLKAFGDELDRSVFLGAGAFGMPQQVGNHWKGSKVDVVEIDPEVIRAGRECFRLDEYPNLEAHASDARRFLATSDHEYDVIFGDAYNGVRYIPAHLTTKEFFETARERLSDRGVFMMNIISGVTGDRAPLFQSLYATIGEVFENVEVFSTSPYNYLEPHNIIIVAGNRDLSPFLGSGSSDTEFQRLAKSRVDPSVYTAEKGPILTDDRNPVEYIVAQQLQRGETRAGSR